MASTAHVGETRALVFPVMSDGYLLLDYSEYNDSNYKHNLWDHKNEPFTFEAILTPYDVNGIGHRTTGQGRLDSTKTPPSPNLTLDDHADDTSSYQSVAYFGSGRNTHKMMLFHNTNFQFYLENTTSSNFNQPAEYKLVCKIVSNSVTHTTESDAVILASNRLKGYYDSAGFYDNGRLVTTKTELSTSASSSSNTITVGSGEANGIGAGNEIFDNSGVLIGTVSSVSGDVITLSASPATTVTSTIYMHQPKEALYLEQISKLSCSFDNRSVSIYVNNTLVQRKRLDIGDFEFDAVDCYIGKDGTNKNTQFMGELYEVCMHKGMNPCATISTLTPNYGDTLFYYTFGE